MSAATYLLLLQSQTDRLEYLEGPFDAQLLSTGTAAVELSGPSGAIEYLAPAGAELLPYTTAVASTPSLQHYWRLAEASGPAIDATGNSTTTVGAGVARSVDGVLPDDLAMAANSTSGGYIDATVVPATLVPPFTVSAWTMLSDAAPSQHEPVWTAWAGAGVNQVAIVAKRNSTGRFFSLWTDAGGWIETPYSLPRDQWHMLSVVFDTAQTRFYVDGDLLGTSAAIPTGAYTQQRLFGSLWNTTERLRGTLDEVQINRAALSTQALKALHDRGRTYHATGSLGQGIVADLRHDGLVMAAAATGNPTDIRYDGVLVPVIGAHTKMFLPFTLPGTL